MNTEEYRGTAMSVKRNRHLNKRAVERPSAFLNAPMVHQLRGFNRCQDVNIYERQIERQMNREIDE